MPLSPELITDTSQPAERSPKSVSFSLIDYHWVFHHMPGELRMQLELATDELNAQREGYVLAKAQWLKTALEEAQCQVNDVDALWGQAYEAYRLAEENEEAIWCCYVDSINRFRVHGSGELTVSQTSKLDKQYENWQESKKMYDFLADQLDARDAELKHAMAFRASRFKEADAKFDAEITHCLLKAIHIASQLNAEEPDFENETTDFLESWEHAAPAVFPPEVLRSNASPELLPATAGSAVTATGCEMGEMLQGEWPYLSANHCFQ